MSTPDRQPTLIGDHVILRPSTAQDWDALYAVASDPLVWEVHPAHDRWQEAVFRPYFEAGLACGGALTVIDKATGAVIGSTRYDDWQPENDQIEIGWTYYARSHWGGPYNREAKRMMLDHIWQSVGTVVFTIGEQNIRSRKAIERIGAVARSGSVERLMAGEMKPHLVYEIKRP